ncbi:Type I Polyketide synthases (Type I PKS) [Penicillium herquei]|nr:Type I Polyketide synthases (Type I PKS) [Penicillium herquei]
MITTILAEEIGISTKKLLKTDDIAELGLDSLLSLTVLGRVHEKLGIELPADFFMGFPSVPAIISSLRTIFEVTERFPKQDFVKHPPATSIMLQDTSSCTQTLFLFPDGSGSSTSYAMLHTISSGLCVYGCSAGGIAASDAAQYLVLQGEVAERLILLDSPSPIGLEKLLLRFCHFLENADVFGTQGGQKPPGWLIQHISSFIDALDQYKPVLFHPERAIPKTTWAVAWW